MPSRAGLLPLALALALTGTLARTAAADEGMWTFEGFPRAKVKQKYGFAPDDRWLEKVRLASVRLPGCSASFVSPNGLIVTNHHCVHGCIEKLSRPGRDHVKDGFLARAERDEKVCAGSEAAQLLEVTDVTARIGRATAGKTGAAYEDARRAETAAIEKACATDARTRCDVVSLYHGGVYVLHKYRRYQDVRLVFAPELAIAAFGGDPDNFNFPRYALDVAFLRAYEDGRPARTPHYLPWSATGVKEGDLTFVSGHPGKTERLLTVAQLEDLRDHGLRHTLVRLARWRGLLMEYQNRSAEARRHSTSTLFYLENGYKATRGRLEALLDRRFFATKVAEEKALRAAVARNPAWKKEFGGAWDAIARAVARQRELRQVHAYLEGRRGISSELFGHARTLVRAADERAKPNGERLREYRDSRLPEVEAKLLAPSRIDPGYEIFRLTHSFIELREELGADHPVVRQILGKESPEELARRLVKGSKLGDPKVRRALWQGGQAAVAASRDPLLVFARAIDPDARAVRRQMDEEVDAVIAKSSELIARARFLVKGRSIYPDATSTLRLSYGTVAGYREGGTTVTPLTTIGGAFARATGREPFALPRRWVAASRTLDVTVPLNVATTNDIIGGNSGSPLIDRTGALVGVIFDGNIHSLGGDFGYEPERNRAIAVHSAGILEALAKVYGATRLLEELGRAPPSGGAASRGAR